MMWLCGFPNGGRLVRIRPTGAVKSTPDEVTCSPAQLQCFTDLPTSVELFSPLAASAALGCSSPASTFSLSLSLLKVYF